MQTALQQGCSICGEPRQFLLHVHHKQRNHNDTKRSSLDSLCGRCHSVRHLRWTVNGWIYDAKFLTPLLVLKYLDMQTQTLHIPKTDRHKKLIKLRDFYLVHLAEDQEEGTKFDKEILSFIDQMEVKESHGTEVDLDALFG
jgi:hypothetical protein